MLKGFLCAKGKGSESARWRNHDIKALLDACLALGLVMTVNTHSLLDDSEGSILAVEELDQSVSPVVSPFCAIKRGDWA
jgi:hypothetical protein